MNAKKVVEVFLGFLLISALLLGPTTEATAQSKTIKYKVSCYLVHFELLPVPDAEGHILTIFSRKGLAFFENGEVATFTNWGTQDITKGKGDGNGYVLFGFDDNSSFMGKFQCAMEPAPKGLVSFNCTGDYIKGAGRFDGIKGTYKILNGRTYTLISKDSKSDMYFEVIGNYTLPSK